MVQIWYVGRYFSTAENTDISKHWSPVQFDHSIRTEQYSRSIEVCVFVHVALRMSFALSQAVNCIFWPIKALNWLVEDSKVARYYPLVTMWFESDLHMSSRATYRHRNTGHRYNLEIELKIG